jgi:disabled homolog 1
MSNTESEALAKSMESSAAENVKRQTSETANSSDPQRFTNGVIIKGKFIGCEDVKEETGDEICQTSMIKLKAVVIAKKEHKQRINVKVTLEGLEIFDEKSNVSMYKHSVNRISYIARDVNDARAIGYIYKNSANNFQYFAIKTERQAQEFFNTLRDLFEAVLELRNAKKADASSNVPANSTDASVTQAPKQDTPINVTQPSTTPAVNPVPPKLDTQKSVNLLDDPPSNNADSLFDFSKIKLLIKAFNFFFFPV